MHKIHVNSIHLLINNASLHFRDNITTRDPDVEYRRELFEKIFSKLEAVGMYTL